MTRIDELYVAQKSRTIQAQSDLLAAIPDLLGLARTMEQILRKHEMWFLDGKPCSCSTCFILRNTLDAFENNR